MIQTSAALKSARVETACLAAVTGVLQQRLHCLGGIKAILMPIRSSAAFADINNIVRLSKQTHIHMDWHLSRCNQY
jgi:hypothetical protein